MAKVLTGFREVYGGSFHKRRDHAVRESGHEVRLEGHGWNPTQNCREHDRPGGVSADSDHNVRTKLRKNLPGTPHCARQIKESLEARRQADILQRTNFHQPKLKTRRWHEAVFDAARSADKHHLGCEVFLQLLRDGNGRNYVPARAASRQNGPHAATINQRRESNLAKAGA